MRSRLFDSRANRAVAPVVVLTVAIVSGACAGGRVVTTSPSAAGAVDVSQLWKEPTDLESRDLALGPGANSPRPDPPVFSFIKSDTSGHSRGYDLRDRNGIEWSVKLGSEAQPEVVVSRILWAIGYHQMPTFYVLRWDMEGGPDGHPGPGRFRPQLPNAKVVDDWSWRDNPFTHTQAFRGLVVANIIVNNWDLKTSNNKIYDIVETDGTLARRYVVRDLGAAFGRAESLFADALGPRIAHGNRNDLEDFESQGFIKRVAGDRVEFDYRGNYQSLEDLVTPADVVWTCRLLSRLSDEQWHAAFAAGGYPPDQTARFVAKLKAKIAEGLALAR